jgi:hypothetical protein
LCLFCLKKGLPLAIRACHLVFFVIAMFVSHKRSKEFDRASPIDDGPEWRKAQ